MLLQPAPACPTHAVRSSWEQSWPAPSGIATLYHPGMSAAFCQTGHPPGFFSFYFYPPVAHSRFSCFSRIWDFPFYSKDPVPVGFEPVRRLRPQPIPFLWGRSLPQEQSYPELLMSLVSDCAQAWTSRPPASGYFQSECKLTSGLGLLPCRSYSILLQTMAVGFLH